MKKKTSKTEVLACPCGSGKSLAECCDLYHAGEPAPDALSLMRSRYSAYALRRQAYLLATWYVTTRPAKLDLAEDGVFKWIGLEVKSFHEEGDTARVSFVARYKSAGRAGRMSENSRFVREGGRWFYVESFE